MSLPLEDIEAEALDLSSKDRARLAHRLLKSLDEEPAEDPAAVRRAWEAELERRLEEYRSGEADTYPASEVFAEARERLRKPVEGNTECYTILGIAQSKVDQGK